MLIFHIINSINENVFDNLYKQSKQIDIDKRNYNVTKRKEINGNYIYRYIKSSYA